MNKKFKILCLVTCVLCLVGSSVSNVYAYKYNRSLDAALTLMLHGEYQSALDECWNLEHIEKKELKGEIWYLRGICFMELNMYVQARKVFKEAIPFAKGDLSTEIYIGIADSYFIERKYSKAITIYEQLLNKIKNEDAYLCAFYYKLGKSFQKESQWSKTKYYFNLLERKFPDSLESKLVKKSSVGGNFFTIQVGCFSNIRNAEKLQRDLEVKGYEVYLTPFKSNGRQFYRVRVGEFMSRIAAQNTEAMLKSKEHLPTHIFP